MLRYQPHAFYTIIRRTSEKGRTENPACKKTNPDLQWEKCPFPVDIVFIKNLCRAQETKKIRTSNSPKWRVSRYPKNQMKRLKLEFSRYLQEIIATDTTPFFHKNNVNSFCVHKNQNKKKNSLTHRTRGCG